MSGTRFYESQSTTSFAPCGWWQSSCAYASQQYWVKRASDGDVAVLLVNNGDAATDLELQLGDVPGLTAFSTYAVRDVNAHVDLGKASGTYTAKAVGSRDSAFLRFKLSTPQG